MRVAVPDFSAPSAPSRVGRQGLPLRMELGHFSAARVSHVVAALASDTRRKLDSKWLSAVSALVCDARPDLKSPLREFLGQPDTGENLLQGLSIGEIGVVYEALLAHLDRSNRKSSGQYFTPDDTAQFMAAQARSFPTGVWLDPCSGVGNLAWHLADTQPDPAEFVRERLALIDLDGTALRTAAAIIVASHAADGDGDALSMLWNRSRVRDYLSEDPLPDHDFVIVNPPYARSIRRPSFQTAGTNELFAYFIERVSETSAGFIAVTPAAYLNVPRYQSLRTVLEHGKPGGDVYVFDNVPDTLFRGYKYGSTNTSSTNFVRGAITVCPPDATTWRITPILRWAAKSRRRMFLSAHRHLVNRRIGPHGEWAKLMRGGENLWEQTERPILRLGDLLVSQPTPFRIDVASTPRYYISGTMRSLDRTSKHVLYFANSLDCDRAYLMLNSSLPYWWWRTLDGGVTLPARTLRSLPLPEFEVDANLLERLHQSDATDIVVKLNAGRYNENVKRPAALIAEVNRCVLGADAPSFDEVYSPDLFSVPAAS